MAKRISRKLAVILHADVVGSTALVQKDETLAHNRIRGTFESCSKTIKAYDGIAHEIRGDALVAEFSRASDAVSAALTFQNENIQHNATLNDDIQPQIRIGISMGEVVIADNTMTGAGVVIAQRLEQLAEPGGVVIHDAAYQTVPRRLPFEYKSFGNQKVKGFEESVNAYAVSLLPGGVIPASDIRKASINNRIIWLGVAVAVVALLILVSGMSKLWQPLGQNSEIQSGDIAQSNLPEHPSLAVLPFASMSDDHEQEYFADGMTDDLITDLSKLSNLLVISRNSTFTYKGKDIKIKQVAQDLGVRYVLEGSVRRVDNHVRINAQLVDGVTGGHLWAERYDGSLSDVFALQDQVTHRIVEALAVTLTPREAEEIVRIETEDVEAHDAYLLGLSYYYRSTPKDNAKAARYFEKAIELDPDYSIAHTALAKVYGRAALRGHRYTRALGISFYQPTAQMWKILGSTVVKSNADYHVLKSWLMLRKRQHRRAIAEARRAIELSPSNSDALEALAEASIYNGNNDEGLTILDQATQVNPAQIARVLNLRGLAAYLQGNALQAVGLLERAIEIDPESIEFSSILSATYAALGRLDEASAAFHAYKEVIIREAQPGLTKVVAWFPHSSQVALDQFARDLLTAGATSNGYMPLASENRLSGEEIKSLLFGARIKGTSFLHYNPWTQSRDTYGNVEHSGESIATSTPYSQRSGVGRIVDDVLCERWPEVAEKGEICVTIFKMYGVDSLVTRRGDYVMVTDRGPMPFRVVK